MEEQEIHKTTVCIAKITGRSINDGCGDCTICTPDEKNQNCPGYRPLNLFLIEVENNPTDNGGTYAIAV